MRNTRHRSLLEANDPDFPQSQYLLDFLKMLVDATSGKQREAYRSKYDAARLVECSRMADVFTEDEMGRIVSECGFRPNQCFMNASKLTKAFPGRVTYCEGMVGVCGIGIDHAICLVDGDRYVDPTMELVLRLDPTEHNYLVYGEYAADELAKAELESGVYGEVTDRAIRKGR